VNTETESTAPKPFIFILMPFDKKFLDIYVYGIKGAAEDAGAYAERIDMMIFNEGILDRLFNQINKADVIVADMTGRNPNVFYEVGYAHALGKIVILLTQNAEDIPFDLKYRQHIVYGGEIQTLRKELTGRLIWAIAESKRQYRQNVSERFIVSISGIEIPEARFFLDIPTVTVEINSRNVKSINVSIRNDSPEPIPAINSLYIFTSAESEIVPGIYEEKIIYREIPKFSLGEISYSTIPENISKPKSLIFTYDSAISNSPDGLTRQYHLEASIHPLPPGAVDHIFITFIKFPSEVDELLKFRMHSSTNFYDFPFRLTKK